MESQKSLLTNVSKHKFEEIEYKCSEEKQASFKDMVNPVYSTNKYAVLELEGDDGGWGEVDVTGSSSEW